MENIKVRVKNKSESEEVQKLFFELGCSHKWDGAVIKDSWRNAKLIYAEDSFLWAGNCSDDFNECKFKELTILQLRDLVVLKRNDKNDRNVIDPEYDAKLYLDSNNKLFVFHLPTQTWKESNLNGEEDVMQRLKPINEKETKEFLVNHNDKWTLQLLDADTEENSFRVAVPSGAEYMTMPNYYFWKDGDLNHSWSIIEQKWTGNKGESIQEYLKTSYSASIVWQRQETKEFLNSKAGYVLQVLPAHAGDDPESGLIEVPELANYAYNNDQGVLFLNGELGFNHPLLLWKRSQHHEELTFVDDEPHIDTYKSEFNVEPKDNVNHPNHYTQGGIECIDALESATIGKQGIEAVCTANIIKYLWRYEEKNGLEDVKKAQWYLNRLIKQLEK